MKRFCIILFTLFTLSPFLTKSQNTCLNLFTTGISPDGYINLEWRWLIPPTNNYGYTLFQWDKVVGWQSTSTNCDKTIQVLNVYPDLPASNTLKTWMDDPAVGLGKIMVTPVTITNFNSNPDGYLKNTSGDYKYDVVMFGSWDFNNFLDLTSISENAVRSFLNSGRGVLFGHDTQRGQHYFFSLLNDKTNLYNEVIGDCVGSDNTKVNNDGFLLKYPHYIPYNTILNIPCSHSTRQFAKGIVWMNFPVLSCDFNAAIMIKEGGTNDFYLTTWNNAALIQTGHSGGQSTLDERKVIANTLWYLSQFTTDRNTKVCSAPDLALPDKPTVNRQANNCKQIEIISKDNGSNYRFYVKAINLINYADTCVSNILDVINRSGLKGFYILENNNPTSNPDISFATFTPAKDNEKIIYILQDISKYTHIQAIDSSGNVSEVFTLPPLAPYKILASVTPLDAGTVSGSGVFNCGENAKLTATPATGYRFVEWQENGTPISTNAVYSFTVTNDRDLTANFRIISSDTVDFDTYAVIICKRVILLNLRKLAEDGYEVTDCKWFKNGIEVKNTHTIDAFGFSEGSDKLLETAPTYYSFRLITKNFGELPSSEKIIIYPDKTPDCSETENFNTLVAYPNPVQQGSMITLEGVVAGSAIYVYNHLGACVLNTIATNNVMRLAFDFPWGIYLIRSEDKILKVVVLK